jgi:hypothetical protein
MAKGVWVRMADPDGAFYDPDTRLMVSRRLPEFVKVRSPRVNQAIDIGRLVVIDENEADALLKEQTGKGIPVQKKEVVEPEVQVQEEEADEPEEDVPSYKKRGPKGRK